MAKKSFKVGDIVVGKTKKYQGKRGKVHAIRVGRNGSLTRVRWVDGQEDEVTCYAINKAGNRPAHRRDTQRPEMEDVDVNDEGEDSSHDEDSDSFHSSEVSINI